MKRSKFVAEMIFRRSTGFIQKMATIFQELFEDHIRFSRTTYLEDNSIDSTKVTKMHIPSLFY